MTKKGNALDLDDVRTDPGELGVAKVDLSLSITIDKNDAHLKDFYDCYLEYPDNRSYNDFKFEMIRLMNEGQITNDTLVDKMFAYTLNKSKDAPFFAAVFFTVLARKAYEAHDELKGWPLIVNACYYAGLSDSIVESEFYKMNIEESQKIAIKASNSRDRSYVSVKRKAAQLLCNNVPEGGWKSKESAISYIEKPLREFIDDNKINLAQLNNKGTEPLKDWLMKWVMIDSAMYYALHDNMTISKNKTTAKENPE